MVISTDDLIEKARAARKTAYAPYSKFLVGAAIEDEAGGVHVGCNVENAAYPLGACAEAGAIAAMIAAGGQIIQRIAIVGGEASADTLIKCTPCGGCRQRIAEFATNDTQIIIPGPSGAAHAYSIADLLPGAFSL